MNSLDAIIALCALMACFALLLGAVIAEQDLAKESNNSLKAKGTAINCASMIDSMFSNSATQYAKELSCYAEKNFVRSSVEEKVKTVPIITTAEKKTFLEVKTLEHYQ